MKSGIMSGLALAAVAISVAAAPGGNKPREAPLTPVAYYAANDAVVGAFFPGMVVMRLSGLTFGITVESGFPTWEDNSGAAWSGNAVSFDQTECTGNSYVDYDMGARGFTGVGAAVYGVAPGEITLYVARTDTKLTYTNYSYLAGGACVNLSEPNTRTGHPVVAVYDLATMFPLPLTIR